jgi:hypothetical protein
VRLYLSSFRVGCGASRLLELLDGATRTAVVGNALDAAPDDVRAPVSGASWTSSGR